MACLHPSFTCASASLFASSSVFAVAFGLLAQWLNWAPLFDVLLAVLQDAVFLSPHKFPGGVGAPGVLVAKRSLFRNAVPSVTGGGTVFFVTSNDHRYLSAREEREEGGTQVAPAGPHGQRCGIVIFMCPTSLK